jgi:hypothetical protein
MTDHCNGSCQPYAMPDVDAATARWLRAAWRCDSPVRSHWVFAHAAAANASNMVIIGTRDVIRECAYLRYPDAWRVVARRFADAGYLEALDDRGDIWRLTLPWALTEPAERAGAGAGV